MICTHLHGKIHIYQRLLHNTHLLRSVKLELQIVNYWISCKLVYFYTWTMSFPWLCKLLIVCAIKYMDKFFFSIISVWYDLLKTKFLDIIKIAILYSVLWQFEKLMEIPRSKSERSCRMVREGSWRWTACCVGWKNMYSRTSIKSNVSPLKAMVGNLARERLLKAL